MAMSFTSNRENDLTLRMMENSKDAKLSDMMMSETDEARKYSL